MASSTQSQPVDVLDIDNRGELDRTAGGGTIDWSDSEPVLRIGGVVQTGTIFPEGCDMLPKARSPFRVIRRTEGAFQANPAACGSGIMILGRNGKVCDGKPTLFLITATRRVDHMTLTGTDGSTFALKHLNGPNPEFYATRGIEIQGWRVSNDDGDIGKKDARMVLGGEGYDTLIFDGLDAPLKLVGSKRIDTMLTSGFTLVAIFNCISSFDLDSVRTENGATLVARIRGSKEQVDYLVFAVKGTAGIASVRDDIGLTLNLSGLGSDKVSNQVDDPTD